MRMTSWSAKAKKEDHHNEHYGVEDTTAAAPRVAILQ
jgi:hypothetical protein